MERTFFDRREAGQALVEPLRALGLDQPLVMALPRGGVPVAFEVAQALDAPLDVLVVRKIGAPFQPELALGAVATGGVRVWNESLLSQMPEAQSPEIQSILRRELKELDRREHAYRGDLPPPEFLGRNVILVDDGLATGATMSAAAESVLAQGAESVVVAVPAGSPRAVRDLEAKVGRVVCPYQPGYFGAVGEAYEDFRPVEDAEVQAVLQASRGLHDGRPAANDV